MFGKLVVRVNVKIASGHCILFTDFELFAEANIDRALGRIALNFVIAVAFFVKPGKIGAFTSHLKKQIFLIGADKHKNKLSSRIFPWFLDVTNKNRSISICIEL